jgi:hypothetical protein
MPKPHVEWPPPAVKGEDCRNCRHWMNSQATEHVLSQTPMGQQWLPLKQFRDMAAKKAEILDTSQMALARMSLCTAQPTWALCGEQHHCGCFKQRLAS